MTGVAAQACGMPPNDLRRDIEDEMGKVRWGPRRAVLSDLAPAATFIAAGVNLPVDAKAFDRRSAEILDEFEAEWGWMYKTIDERGMERPIDFVIWSEVFTCPSCAGSITFYEVAFNTNTGKVSDTFHCPSCGKELNKDRVERRKTTIRTLAGDSTERIDLKPVAVQAKGASKLKPIDDGDLAVLRRVASASLPQPVPTLPLPIDQMVHGSRLAPKGFTHVHHMWGDRALLSLSALWTMAMAEGDPLLRHALLFWVEQAMWGMSWQNRYRADGYSQVSQFQSGIYYVPSLHSETNPRYNLGGSSAARGKRRSLVKTWEASPARLGRTMIVTGSSTRLELPDACIDYVFVDPPFGANIPYSDLAILVESWHRVRTNANEEAVMGRSARFVRTLSEYGELMEQCFAEFHRVLKPGRWMTVEFSNSSNDVWLTIQHALAKAGFVVADTRIIDKA